VRFRDLAFQRVFARSFVYNILFEDAEVDERYLGINEDSTVLSITGAGCGVAGMVSRRPRSLDAVDLNRHHLALAALKATAAQHMTSYEDFYDLLGRGWSPDPNVRMASLRHALPAWAATYWDRHADRFSASLYLEGLTARMLSAVRRRAGIDVQWTRELCALPVEERVRRVREVLAPINTPLARAILASPLQLLALGINFQQRDRLVSTEQLPMADYFVEHLTRVMDTDLTHNWFFWYAAGGQFNHASQDAVPPYLRRDRWERSLGAPTKMTFQNRNLFDVLKAAGPRTWSHYTLCDAVDWMPAPIQRELFQEIRRTARPGAVVLLRSVEHADPVVTVGADAWMTKRATSADASRADRTRQYRQVNFYEVSA
jgi:S-adenosylmethionine-diacylglycerol 3-amino-3-carboxypropyl transferase